MAIISFALTKEEFVTGRKTVTRRNWKPSHMANWQRWFDEGRRLHDAYDKVPFAGGKQIGWFRLVERPYWEALADMPKADLLAEGGMCDTLEDFYDLVGLPPEHVVAVIRFERV
jgi:hypothetical protein